MNTLTTTDVRDERSLVPSAALGEIVAPPQPTTWKERVLEWLAPLSPTEQAQRKLVGAQKALLTTRVQLQDVVEEIMSLGNQIGQNLDMLDCLTEIGVNVMMILLADQYGQTRKAKNLDEKLPALLFKSGIPGLQSLSRGGKGPVRQALREIIVDITVATMATVGRTINDLQQDMADYVVRYTELSDSLGDAQAAARRRKIDLFVLQVSEPLAEAFKLLADFDEAAGRSAAPQEVMMHRLALPVNTNVRPDMHVIHEKLELKARQQLSLPAPTSEDDLVEKVQQHEEVITNVTG